MATTNITIRMDKNLKKRAEALFDDMGLNLTTAFIVFTKAVIREGRIPFEIAADPFLAAENRARLSAAAADLDAGEGLVSKSMKELEKMAK